MTLVNLFGIIILSIEEKTELIITPIMIVLINYKQLSTIVKDTRKFRKEQSLSQNRLSKEVEVAYNTIVKIESGENPNPTVDTLERIAKALSVPIESCLRDNICQKILNDII